MTSYIINSQEGKQEAGGREIKVLQFVNTVNFTNYLLYFNYQAVFYIDRSPLDTLLMCEAANI